MTIDNRFLQGYFRSLVNRFFKILPMRESDEETLTVYIQSLQTEMIGSKELFDLIDYDPSFVTLLSILQYMIDNPCCTVPETRREVFRAINICNKLSEKYSEGGDEE